MSASFKSKFKNQNSLIALALSLRLHYLPEHLKKELRRLQKEEQRKKLILASYGIKDSLERLNGQMQLSTQEFKRLGFTFNKTKPARSKSKRPRRWVNKFYSRQP